LADLGDRGTVPSIQGQVRASGVGSIQKQPCRVDAGQLLYAGSGLRNRQGAQTDNPLASNLQRLPAGRKNHQIGAPPQERLGQIRCRIQQVLAAIQA
jgi:hypothetical protein